VLPKNNYSITREKVTLKKEQQKKEEKNKSKPCRLDLKRWFPRKNNC